MWTNGRVVKLADTPGLPARNAEVAKLVDAPGLGPGGETLESSNLSFGTT